MTRSASLFLVTLVSFACAAPPSPPAAGGCGGFICGVRERCESSTMRCVEDLPPALRVAGPEGVVASGHFTVTGVVADDAARPRLQWRLGEAGEWAPLQAADDGAFSFEVETPALDAAAVDVTVRATDAVTTVERAARVQVDRVGPRVTVLAPAADALVVGPRVTVTVQLDDGSHALSAVTVLGQTRAVSQPGVVTLEVPLPAADLHTVEAVVEATDAHGNTTRAPLRFRSDTAGPSGRFVGFSPDMTPLGGGRVAVVFAPEDGSGTQRVTFSTSAGGAAPVPGVLTAQGQYAASLVLPAGVGRVALHADLLDGVGNASRVTLTVPYDSEPPEVTLLAPLAGAIVGSSCPVVVSAASDTAAVSARLGGAVASLQREADGTWRGVLQPSPGDFVSATLEVEARDASGNVQRLPGVALRVDTVPPRVVFLSPSAGALLGSAALSGNAEVLVRWRVDDGNPAAATLSVQGVSSSASEHREPTAPTDDGAPHAVTVVASDGPNAVTATLSFTVDRVAPRVVAWTPEAGARNAEASVTLSFSEPVFATSGGDPAVLSPARGGGSWAPGHAAWTLPGLPGGAVFSMTLAPLVDLAGNALAPPPARRFHLAVVTPPSDTTLVTDARAFKAVASEDGAVVLAVRRSTDLVLVRLSPATGAVETLEVLPGAPAQFELTGSSRVDAASLEERFSFALSADLGGAVTRTVWTGGARAALPGVSGTGAVVTTPAQDGEGTSFEYGAIAGSSYVRGAVSATLPLAPSTVAQGPGGWFGYAAARGLVSWVRYTCTSTPALSACNQFTFDATASGVTNLRGVVHPAGSCLVSGWDAAGQRHVLFQPLSACPLPLGLNPPASCRSTSGLRPMVRSDGLKVAPFTLGSQRTLLGAYVDAGLQLGTLSRPSACEPRFDPIGRPLADAVLQFEPIQVGNRAALLYIDGSHVLKLFVP